MNKKKICVLVFPAGEVNSVELHDALATCVNIDLYGASSADKHGEYIFRNYISGLPMVYEDNFFEEFNKIINTYNIDIVFPTHDTVAKIFAENRDKLNAKVIAADKETAEICRDKARTYHMFGDEKFCPKIYSQISSFPVFIKPIEGQGAVGTKLIKGPQDVPSELDFSKYVICEYLPGEEYTVDCFTDKSGTLKAILPRNRGRLLAGITVSSTDIEDSGEFQEIAHSINQKLKFRGLWWFQVKRDHNGDLKLLEISTRCAGTMCMARAMGVNLPLLSVYDAMGWEIEVMPNPYHIVMDRTLISRYKISYFYNTVYFDFDDTLIINEKIHLPSIWFLYQCKNQNKTVILLTKHISDIYEDLKKYHIDQGIFDKIIGIAPEDSKSDYIAPEHAIFIDNAYSERKDVYKKHNIPVFDVDAIEVLMNWRS